VTPLLLAIVDGVAASSALAKPDVRMSVLDATIPPEILANVKAKKKIYRNYRKERESVEDSMGNRVLPKGFSLMISSSDADAKLLAHWINELDAFESRVMRLCESFDGLESRKSKKPPAPPPPPSISWI
jgi:hypothetical protein